MSTSEAAFAPTAERRVELLLAHGDEREDPWHWLRNRDDRSVVEHLEAENRYCDAVLEHLAPLRAQLFEEIRRRTPEADTSEPVPYGPFEYYVRTVEGAAYPLLCRRPRGAGESDDVASEQVMIDGNLEAGDSKFFSLGSATVSPDHRYLAYCVDRSGHERHKLRIRDLSSGVDLPDEIDDVYYGLAWADDSRTLFYVRPDDAMRPHQVLRHRLGEAPADDANVHREQDDRFFVAVERSRSGRYVLISAESKSTSECLVVPTSDPDQPPRSIAGRREGVLYYLDHQRRRGGDGRFVSMTNDAGPDFRVVAIPESATSSEAADPDEIVPHRAGTRIEEVDAFDGFVVLTERANATTSLRILATDRDLTVGHSEPVHSVCIGPNREPDASSVRFEYSSPMTAPMSIDISAVDGTRDVVKRCRVLDDFDPARYVAERLWAETRDGARVPISLVRAEDVSGPAPLVLYGYGAYETSTEPSFSYSRLSLLERGVTYAIAHVRGGGEMGRAWYEGGRLERKRNSFTDFVACAEHLVAAGYAQPRKIVARGRSAGGLLMGAVANLAPELFAAIVAEVPFVDVLTTMQDPTLPLTITEWDEWGNPIADEAIYHLMRSYSPYDNVTDQPYPAILATCGLHDSRVQYWEPAKWVLRLREHTTSDAPILLRSDLGSGHMGPSGRFDAWREESFVMAFILDQLGLGA